MKGLTSSQGQATGTQRQRHHIIGVVIMSSNNNVSNNDFREGNDLAKQINALQRAVAIERGENHRFREEIMKLLRHRDW
jgi:hypothetical protein